MLENKDWVSLSDFAARQFRQPATEDKELPALLNDISEAVKQVSFEVNRAALDGKLGMTGSVNVQGEQVEKLDQYANEIFIHTLSKGGHCAGLVSEETEEAMIFDEESNNQSGYVVLIDPIDGSANIDVNIAIGSIFSIYSRISERGKPAELKDFLQTGEHLVAAGYAIYGPSTVVVYAAGGCVNGFTLDHSQEKFLLTHADLRMPPRGQFYSFDNSYYNRIDPRLKNYVNFCMSKENENGPYSNRYYGCLVADMHRNLLKGGIYFYSRVEGKPEGKLRLCYECNPMSFIAEAAGGRGINGSRRILEIKPNHIHQRSPLFIGSAEMIGELERFLM